MDMAQSDYCWQIALVAAVLALQMGHCIVIVDWKSQN
jgi:hypothetical protein